MTMASKLAQSPWSEFWAGARQTIPLIVGAIPFGIIFGTLAQSSGLSFGGAMGMSAIVFAGSSQFIALGLLGAGTPLGIIVLTTWVVNLRHLLYAVSLVPYVKHLNQAWKLPLGFWLTDENFMVAIQRYRQDDPSPHKHWFQLGVRPGHVCQLAAVYPTGVDPGAKHSQCSCLGVGLCHGGHVHWHDYPLPNQSPYGGHRSCVGDYRPSCSGIAPPMGLMVAAIAGILTGILTENQLDHNTHD